MCRSGASDLAVKVSCQNSVSTTDFGNVSFATYVAIVVVIKSVPTVENFRTAIALLTEFDAGQRESGFGAEVDTGFTGHFLDVDVASSGEGTFGFAFGEAAVVDVAIVERKRSWGTTRWEDSALH